MRRHSCFSATRTPPWPRAAAMADRMRPIRHRRIHHLLIPHLLTHRRLTPHRLTHRRRLLTPRPHVRHRHRGAIRRRPHQARAVAPPTPRALRPPSHVATSRRHVHRPRGPGGRPRDARAPPRPSLRSRFTSSTRRRLLHGVGYITPTQARAPSTIRITPRQRPSSSGRRRIRPT